MKTYHIGEREISLSDLQEILHGELQLELSEKAALGIKECRSFLESKISSGKNVFYGINTGFGSLCNVSIPDSDLGELQLNLVRSHACGSGEQVTDPIVKLMLLLKIQSLSLGKSGVRIELVQLLIDLFNRNLLPVIYNQGSLGASGDLAPLAHLALALLGEGELKKDGQVRPAGEWLKAEGLSPINLKAKEGLALLNGTQFMSAYASYIILESGRLLAGANRIMALSAEAFYCRIEPFHPLIHQARPHKGQQLVAKEVYAILAQSDLLKESDKSVQDPYSFRCVPQVHGGSFQVIQHAIDVLLTEINSVTDNPNVFPDDDAILSGGNFHGQPLALILDYLAIGIAEIASISERRTYQLIGGARGLAPYLAEDAGKESGLMIPQYTAASIVSQNKGLCHPASIDSIPSSNGQEDHVSMGANAATKCLRVLENSRRVVGIEWLTATKAMLERNWQKASTENLKLLERFQQASPPLNGDQIWHAHILNTEELMQREFDFPIEWFE